MGFLEERDLTAVPTIPEFYKGKTIFVTGGSGLMGKVLIEKLLYSCPDLDRIYLLLRNKKGVKSEDRLRELYSCACFDRLRESKENPSILESKVFAVAGDVTEEGLGLSDDDRTLLVNRVNIIFHIAASVRFNDSLKFAVDMNLRGTKRVVELAEEIRNLSVFLHVSTTYSNTNRNPIYEVMYPPLADWRDTLAVCDTLDEHTVRVLTSKYLGELPNTYTFTKQLADHLVYEHKGKLPIVIVRPSIVVSSKEEPFPGWVDSFNGPISLFVASGKGIINSVYAEPNLLSDYIPVDISIRNIVAAAWIRGTKKLEATDDIPIYNSCSGNLKHYYLEGLVEMAKHITVSIPFNNIIWVPNGSLTAYKSIHYIKVIFLHLLPSLLIDGILLLSNKKPMLVKIQRRIYIANLAIQYFLTMQWTFDNKNTLTLRSCIKEVDKKAFFYDIENLDIYNFMCNSVYGVKKYLLKEKDEDLPKAKRDYRRLYVLNIIVRFLFYGFIFWKLFNTAFVQELIEGCFSLFDF